MIHAEGTPETRGHFFIQQNHYKRHRVQCTIAVKILHSSLHSVRATNPSGLHSFFQLLFLHSLACLPSCSPRLAILLSLSHITFSAVSRRECSFQRLSNSRSIRKLPITNGEISMLQNSESFLPYSRLNLRYSRHGKFLQKSRSTNYLTA